MGTGGAATGGKLTCAPWLAAAFAVVLGVAGPAGADFYQFTFGGVVDVVDGIVPEPWDGVHVGSEFEFSYIFDSEAEDQVGHPSFGLYYIESAEVTIDGVVQATSDGQIHIHDVIAGYDTYVAYFSDLPIGASGNVSLDGLDVIDSDELLLDIDLDDWDDKLFELIGNGFTLRGDVTSFSGQIVPSPSAIGLLGYAILRPGRRRQILRKRI